MLLDEYARRWLSVPEIIRERWHAPFAGPRPRLCGLRPGIPPRPFRPRQWRRFHRVWPPPQVKNQAAIYLGATPQCRPPAHARSLAARFFDQGRLLAQILPAQPARDSRRSEERRVGKECRSR